MQARCEVSGLGSVPAFEDEAIGILDLDSLWSTSVAQHEHTVCLVDVAVLGILNPGTEGVEG